MTEPTQTDLTQTQTPPPGDQADARKAPARAEARNDKASSWGPEPEAALKRGDFALLSDLLNGATGAELAYRHAAYRERLLAGDFLAAPLDTPLDLGGRKGNDELVLNTPTLQAWHANISLEYRISQLHRDSSAVFSREEAERRFREIATRRIQQARKAPPKAKGGESSKAP